MGIQAVPSDNHRGVRIPKPLTGEAALSKEVEMRARAGAIVIYSARSPRAGWAKTARALRERSESGLLDATTPTRFDEQEWKW